jgi:REP element-mobilizing transposase RayT
LKTQRLVYPSPASGEECRPVARAGRRHRQTHRFGLRMKPRVARSDFDNSPAIHGWVRGPAMVQVPPGTKEMFYRPWRDLEIRMARFPAMNGWAIVRRRLSRCYPNIDFMRLSQYFEITMHSFNSCLMHCVFSTSERRPWLTPAIRERLWPYLGGIARENDMKALAIGGVTDHVHLLLSLPATLSVSKAMQLLKGNSSKWLRETFPELRSQGFSWQEGFGAFSIGVSGVEDTRHYIQTQEEHHRKKSFREELEVFLKKHGYDYKAEMLG